ncbi:MAG: hypothetical protein RI907_3703, partial [Pseudomonadota bacterium]
MASLPRPWLNSVQAAEAGEASPSQLNEPPPPAPAPPPPQRRWFPSRLHHQLALMVSVALVSALGLLGGYTALEQTQIALKTYEEQALALARHMGAASHQAMVGAQP